MSEPFAYVAHKDDKWGGVCSATAGKKSVKEFLAEFISDGFTVQPVATRKEYDDLTTKLAPWWGTADPVGGSGHRGSSDLQKSTTD